MGILHYKDRTIGIKVSTPVDMDFFTVSSYDAGEYEAVGTRTESSLTIAPSGL